MGKVLCRIASVSISANQLDCRYTERVVEAYQGMQCRHSASMVSLSASPAGLSGWVPRGGGAMYELMCKYLFGYVYLCDFIALMLCKSVCRNNDQICSFPQLFLSADWIHDWRGSCCTGSIGRCTKGWGVNVGLRECLSDRGLCNLVYH